MHTIRAFLVISAVLVTVEAHATTCENGATECDGGDTNDICEVKYGVPDPSLSGLGSVLYYDCALLVNGDYDDATLTAYTDTSTGDTYFWGTDADSNDYCCVNDQAVSYLRVVGSTFDDTIDLNWTDTSTSTTYTTTAYTNTYLWGTSGDDTITGSDSSLVVDKIGGGDGSDTLYGLRGIDFLYGGGYRDYLYGGDGDDQMKGGDGNDDMWGNADDDNMDGGPGDDRLKGGDGNDNLWGMEDDDLLCGESSTSLGNNLYGWTGDDVMYAGTVYSAASGGPGIDDCGNIGGLHTLGCEYRVQSSCPW